MLTWQNRLTRWLDRRIPAARHFKLNHRSIFIFPSRFGGLFLFLCAGLYLLGTNYQNNLMIILCYFLVSLFLLNLFTAYINFSKLDIQLGKVSNGFAMDNLQLPIWFNHNESDTLQPHGKITVCFWQSDSLIEIDLDGLTNPVYLALPLKARGKIILPRITFTSYFPLGLFRCWTHLAFDAQLIAYPQPIYSPINLVSAHSDAGNGKSTQQIAGHEDFDSLAPYKQGESLHHVAWKQMAKGQGMITKHFSDDKSSAGWLVLQYSNPRQLEEQLSRLCHQVTELSRSGQLFGLDLGQVKIEPSQGTTHQHRCLSALALYPDVSGEKHSV